MWEMQKQVIIIAVWEREVAPIHQKFYDFVNLFTYELQKRHGSPMHARIKVFLWWEIHSVGPGKPFESIQKNLHVALVYLS